MCWNYLSPHCSKRLSSPRVFPSPLGTVQFRLFHAHRLSPPKTGKNEREFVYLLCRSRRAQVFCLQMWFLVVLLPYGLLPYGLLPYNLLPYNDFLLCYGFLWFLTL